MLHEGFWILLIQKNKNLNEGCVHCSKDEGGHKDMRTPVPNWILRKRVYYYYFLYYYLLLPLALLTPSGFFNGLLGDPLYSSFSARRPRCTELLHFISSYPLNLITKLNSSFFQISDSLLFNFIPDLIVCLPDSRILSSMNFSVSFTSVKFPMLLTKIEFHVTNTGWPKSRYTVIKSRVWVQK